jgi:hypothetical protein
VEWILKREEELKVEEERIEEMREVEERLRLWETSHKGIALLRLQRYKSDV